MFFSTFFWIFAGGTHPKKLKKTWSKMAWNGLKCILNTTFFFWNVENALVRTPLPGSLTSPSPMYLLDHSYDTDLHFKDTKKSSLLFWSSCNICRFPGGQVPLGNPPRIWAYYTTICRDMSLSFCKWISISTEILRNCLLLAEKKARILKTAVAFSDCGGAREPSIGIWRKMERNSFSSRLIMIQNSRNVF